MPCMNLQPTGRAMTAALLTASCLWLGGCALPTSPPSSPAFQVQMPLLRGWYEGKAVFYITTDVSDASVAKLKRANFAPRLGHALTATPAGSTAAVKPSSVDKVYAVTNFAQGSVFASAPQPMGYQNTESAYTPLWQMVTVTWKPGAAARSLTSEDEVLDAQEKGQVALQLTDVILNCPIVHRGAEGALPDVTLNQR
jgi:hypothetical protein